MLRFILFFILFLILYYILNTLIQDIFPLKKKRNKETETEELVQDPNCLTYIPKRLAIKKKIAGNIHYFCNHECMKKYLRRKK